MERKPFGALVASVVSTFLSAQAFAAEPPKSAGTAAKEAKPADAKPADAKPAAAGKPAAGGKCVHNCAGYAECKGNGNNSCKGKNSCANEGIVPKECSSAASEQACKDVKDKKNDSMCTWQAG